MQTHAFKDWLRSQYLQLSGQPLAPGTQVSRTANCSTIEEWEGDLDAHFEKDGMIGLLEKLTYTRSDQTSKLEPRHHIPIDGDVSNGSTTYRSAANLYRKFRVAQQNGCVSADSQRRGAKPTEMSRTTRVRLGQERFRYMVMERWDYRCAATGASILLTASHIKPWRFSSDIERLDALNGICLSPVFDKAFDTGLITFRFDGLMVISPLVQRTDALRIGLLGNTKLRGLNGHHRPYLEFHHNNIWKHCGHSIHDRTLYSAA